MSRFRIGAAIILLSSLVLSMSAAGAAQQFPESSYQELHWRMIGPLRGGRTRAAAGVPNQPNVFYIGVVNGGVWKSDDYGRIWTPIFDQEPTQSIGAIAVAPSDPNIIYVGSGEGLHRPDLSVGDGIYRSADAGKTWTHLGLRNGQQIPALAVDPHDPNRLFAAVLGRPYGPSEERGIFRSTDGGASWQKILYKDENTGGADVALDPSNPDVVYASLWEVRQGPWEDGNIFSGTEGGLFKSTDGGKTWKKLTHGLPDDVVQVNIAVAPSLSSRIYISVGTTKPGGYASGEGLGIYRSDDAGENWYRATDDPRPAMRIGGGDLSVLRVDPKNPDVVYSASIVTVRSLDGGKTWSSIRGAPSGDDYQNLWINPNNSDIILLVSDQGAIVSVNRGATWSSWYNQPTAQLYHVSTSNGFPYRVCGGQQESGSVCTLSRGNEGVITLRDWMPVGAIEYGYVVPDPLDPDIVYGGGRTEVSKFHWSTGQVQNITPIPLRNKKYRAERTEPTMFSPLDPHSLYYATNVLFKTTDGGISWQTVSRDLTRPEPGAPPSVGPLLSKNPDAAKKRGAIYALGLSYKNVDTMWAGTDDGLIWVTRDGGKNWTNITPPELTPWSKVTQLDVSHFDDKSAYASVSRFRVDDLRPYIYRTHDGGKTWQSIVNGLPPDAPVDTVREDPVRKGLLFAGTEKAVWVSFDDGDHWQSLQLNLPHTSMRDLWIHENDLIVATHGRSFWILDDISPLRQLSRDAATSDYLFRPSAAYRIRRSTHTDTPTPPDEPAGENPPAGAIIDYSLGQDASPVILEIRDANDSVVRRFSSADQPEQTEAELSKELIPLYWLRPHKALAESAGMHRWVWDLHYATPTAAHHEYLSSAVPHDTPRHPLGPRALPGEYKVKLTVNGHSYTAPLTIKMDPRVTATEAGLRQMFGLQAQLALLVTKTSEAVMQAQSIREQIDTAAAKVTGDAATAVEEFKKKIKSFTDGPDKPEPGTEPLTLKSVNDAATSLYNDVDKADAAPTLAQNDAATTTERNGAQVLKGWDAMRIVELSSLNQALRKAGQTEINPEARPQTMGGTDTDSE